MKNILKYLICIPLVAIFCGCSLNIPPPDQFSDPDAITTVSTARSLLTSAYISYPHYEYQLSILGEDFCPTSLSGKDVEQQNLYRWQDNSITELADAVSYGELKMWFLSVYPEAERLEVNEILAKAKKAREAQKAARQAA